jgi:UDP-2,3-diacylglucosamine pyrophosphatase LpxH
VEAEMLNIEDQQPDSYKDELAVSIAQLEKLETWDAEAKQLFKKIERLCQRKKFIFFTGDFRDYHLTRKGQSAIYDVPMNQRGKLEKFRGKRVRVICMGGWDSYAGRWFYAGEV